MKRSRGGLVFKAHRLFVSLNSRLESNKEEESSGGGGGGARISGDTTLCKVTPAITGVTLQSLRSSYTGFYPQRIGDRRTPLRAVCGEVVHEYKGELSTNISRVQGAGCRV